MSRIQIDRLSLHVPGMSGQETERLVRLVAERLAVSDVPAVRGRLGAVELRVSDAGPDAKSLADRIADDLMRELETSL